MVSIKHKERKALRGNGPNRIGVVRWVLGIWMSDRGVVWIYQSGAEKKGQGVLRRDGYTMGRRNKGSDVRVDVCELGDREAPSDDR